MALRWDRWFKLATAKWIEPVLGSATRPAATHDHKGGGDGKRRATPRQPEGGSAAGPLCSRAAPCAAAAAPTSRRG